MSQREIIRWLMNIGFNSKEARILLLLAQKGPMTVNEIAEMMIKELKLKPVIKYTGGEAGWVGDIPRIKMSRNKIKRLGWEPTINIEEGIKRYIKWLSKK